MKLLNLGCGTKYHKKWINIDYHSNNKYVKAYNLLKGIPYKENSIHVVYSSHLIEHFSKADAERCIKDCYRVLKLGGIIRVATPDLEKIVSNYQKYIKLALRNIPKAEFRYDWSMIEMYDQTVREYSGGEMGKLYQQKNIEDPNFIYKRVGFKIEDMQVDPKIKLKRKVISVAGKLINILSYFNPNDILLRFILGRNYIYYNLGKFRRSGEIHLWMYDRFSLARLLKNNGFKNIKVCTAFESNISEWNSYYLDINKDGTVYKPDSFYMEGIKQ